MGVGLGGSGQGGCVQRIEVFGKIHKKNMGGKGGGCEQRIEVFVKIQKKKKMGGGGGGEMCKIEVFGKKKFLGRERGVSVGGRVGGGSGWM